MSTFEAFTQLIEETETVLKTFITARDQSSAEQWDKWNDDPLLSSLLDSLNDLEFTAEKG